MGGAEKRETSGERRSRHSNLGTEKADERQRQEGTEYAYVHVQECQNNQAPSKPTRARICRETGVAVENYV